MEAVAMHGALRSACGLSSPSPQTSKNVGPPDASLRVPERAHFRVQSGSNAGLNLGTSGHAALHQAVPSRGRPSWVAQAVSADKEATEPAAAPAGAAVSRPEDDVGEVEKILTSRVVEGGATEYLIQWKDEYPDSWEPRENVAPGLVEDFEKPWWVAARKGDEKELMEMLAAGRDPNAIEENRRTALFFAAGFGKEKCTQILLDAGADVHWQDVEGYTPLHMAAGYMHSTCVKALLDRGADPELEDKQQRSALVLAQQLLEKTPANNPLTLGRRLALDQVVKLLDEAVFEEVEVQQVLDRRIGEGGVIEFLVRWTDGSEDSWEPAENIGEDLVRDYEQGLEYGVVERILEKRKVEAGQGEEYLVKWADSEENTWEPLENLDPEAVAQFEGVSVEDVERRMQGQA